MKKTVAVFLAAASLALTFGATPAAAAYSQNEAASYLKSRPIEEWSVMALSATGNLSGVNLEFLKNPLASGSATDYEKRILAIAAAGQNPATFGAEDFTAKLLGKFDGTQIGDPALLNDDIFGILALAADNSGKTSGTAIAVAASKTYLASRQNADGGWGYAVGVASDSNDTAMAVSALLATGTSPADPAIGQALAYIAGLKHSDGGYGYDAAFPSDTASTAWVANALIKTGRDMPAETRTFLENQQLPDGSFSWLFGEKSGSALMTAYALIALSGKTYPVLAAAGQTAAANSYTACIFGAGGRNIWSGNLNFLPPAYAIDAVKDGAKAGGFTYNIVNTSLGAYVQSIAGEEAGGVHGWFYAVNGTSPSVGAANYPLNANDVVVWFFGQYGDPIPSCQANAQNPGGQASGSVGLSVTIEMPAPVISFTVSPSSLNFGTLRPGQQANQTLNFANTGTVAINVSAQVQDSSNLFKDHLRLDSQTLAGWKVNISSGQGRNAIATLAVPQNFGNAGARNASITFWATP